MPFDRNRGHVLALVIIAVGTVAIVMSIQQDRSFAQEEVGRDVCGDEICNGDEKRETCGTCPQDCGICFPKERPICGDSLCEKGDCRRDCISQTPEDISKWGILEPLEEMEPPIIQPELIEKAPVQAVKKTFNRLSGIISKDESFKRRLEESEGSDFVGLIFGGDGRSTMKRISTILIELREEGEQVRTMILQDVLLNPSVSRLLQNLPGQKELHEAAIEGKLSVVRDYLPTPTKNLQRSLAEVEEYRHLLETHYPDLFVSRGSLLLPKAIADETPLPLDAKEGLVESIFLRKRMEGLGIDPKTGLSSLENDIGNLMKRKKTLSGIIGIMEEDLDKELGSAQETIDSPSTKRLLNVRGIFLYLRTTANFVTLEKTYRSAVTDMRTGIARVGSLFSFYRFSPSVEAAELLGGELAASLQNPDMEEKKKATVVLFGLQNPLIESMLQELPEEERTMHVDAFERIHEEASAAKTPVEIQQTITSFSDALFALERDARSERSILRRPIYFLQDFFGRS